MALGKVVFTSREHIIVLEPRDKGMIGMTLRYPYEVRKAKEYFDDIGDEKVPKDMLELAVHIVDTKRGKFTPKKFEDQYEGALKELIRKKAERRDDRSPESAGLECSELDGCVAAERSSRKRRSTARQKKPKSGSRDSAKCCCP